jgi:hypothetical protein
LLHRSNSSRPGRRVTAEQGFKARLLEVEVIGQSAGEAPFPHQMERNTVSE